MRKQPKKIGLAIIGAGRVGLIRGELAARHPVVGWIGIAETNPERAKFSRYSMPFFLHLRSDFPIQTLPQCISAENPDRYPEPITADEFLQQRLREIGLKK